MITDNKPDSSEDNGMLVDQFGRQISYLRLSVTDACNLRCIYCMPEENSFRPPGDLMCDDEVLRLARVFAAAGFNKIRVTGGEPTIRPGIVRICSELGDIDGIKEVGITTNGMTLRELAAPLRDAGLKRVNVRFDTLDPDKFRKMSRCGDLAQVWAGLKSAQNAGLEIKLNTVVVRGWNDGQDIARIASLTREHAWHVRFIELMPLGRIAQVQQARVVSSEETMNTVTEALGALLPMKTVGGDAEAARYRLEGAPGTIGFISSVTRPFCRRCHRVRLTSDGRLRLCLLRENEVDLLTPLRSGATDAELLGLVREGIYRKPLEHGLHGNILARNRIMSEIGG